ncbi:MAG: hypothetical protein ACOY6E_09205 [Pseudomonadota bacterium]
MATDKITRHPACPTVSALSCLDSINLSIEHAAGHAETLRAVLAGTAQPVAARWMYSLAATVRIEAADIEYCIGLWQRLPEEALSDADRQAIDRQLAVVIRHVEGIERCADHAAAVAVDRVYMLGIAGRLISALKAMARRVQAIHRAGQAPTAPAA